MLDEREQRRAKIVVMGDPAVGKTSLIRRFVEGTFTESYVMTIGVSFFVKEVEMGDTSVKLALWDMVGADRFKFMAGSYFKGTAGAIVIFDITRSATFRPGVLNWLEEMVGWEWIYNRIEYLAKYACNALGELPGVTILTPTGSQAGLVTFNVDGLDPSKTMLKLAKDGIILRFIRHPYALRISTGFYNTETDIDRLVTALRSHLEG